VQASLSSIGYDAAIRARVILFDVNMPDVTVEVVEEPQHAFQPLSLALAAQLEYCHRGIGTCDADTLTALAVRDGDWILLKVRKRTLRLVALSEFFPTSAFCRPITPLVFASCDILSLHLATPTLLANGRTGALVSRPPRHLPKQKGRTLSVSTPTMLRIWGSSPGQKVWVCVVWRRLRCHTGITLCR
jgi:hypothetical protein